MKQQLIDSHVVEVVNDSVTSMVTKKINAVGCDDKDDAFFVGDLGDIINKYKLWHAQLPRVEPHYAVKCNDDPAILSLLAQLGVGFDCASKAEIQRILDLKVQASRVIYANPCKQTSYIKFAAKHGISLMTFDNEAELHKVKFNFPTAKLIVRILPPEGKKCKCELGMKFGVAPRNVPHLLQVAKKLDLDVVGVSFHVGSDCYDATAFSGAVALAHTVFEMGKEAGYNFNLLDIGGGFPGQVTAKITFEEICAVLRPALDTYFPESSGVRIIAEPGRFFVASAFTLAVNIIAMRSISRDKKDEEDMPSPDEEPAFMYYVNDGVYGSFNCLLYDHAEVEPELLDDHSDEPTFTTSIWGPTCDGLDCIIKECMLPELSSGEWILFRDMGAYTMCAASNFNGMPKPRVYYMAQEYMWNQLGGAACMIKYLPSGHGLKYASLATGGREAVEENLHSLLHERLVLSPEM